MNQNLNSKNIENHELNLDDKKTDYYNLTTKLKEINRTIALLGKTIFK